MRLDDIPFVGSAKMSQSSGSLIEAAIITDQSAKTSRSPGNPCEFRARSARALEAVLEKAYLASKRPLNALEQSRKLFLYTLLANQKLDIYV